MRLKPVYTLFLLLVFLTGPALRAEEALMELTSPVFPNNAMLPAKYTCQGEDISPPLAVTGIPKGTVTLALINDDPDAPGGTWDHWIVWNIPPAGGIAQNTVPGIQGKNSWGRSHYGGPCPPSGTHRYFFKLYALDGKLALKEGARKVDVLKAMEGHVLAQAQLIGLYKKS